MTTWTDLDDEDLFFRLLEHGITFGRAELLVRYRDEPSRVAAIDEILSA